MVKSKDLSDPDHSTGLQTIRRAASVLRSLSERAKDGMRLSEIAEATELHKATAFRVLAALIQEGLVEQGSAKTYHLGAATWLLGTAAAPRYDIRQLSSRALDRIAEVSGDTAFLSIRSGPHAVCIDRREGAFPIRTLTLEVGSRRPLGVGAGSLALLAFLPDDEISQALNTNAKALRHYPQLTLDKIWRMIAETRTNGYAFNKGQIIEGMSAIGVPIFDHLNRPTVALTCAAINSRMDDDRRDTIVALLQKEANLISRQLNPRGADQASSNIAQSKNKLLLRAK